MWKDLYVGLNDSPSGVLFIDTDKLENSNPKITLGIPVMISPFNIWQMRCLWLYNRTPFLAFIPKELEIIDEKELEYLKGDVNAWRYKGYLVAPIDRSEKEMSTLAVKKLYNFGYESGKSEIREVTVFPFISTLREGMRKDTMILIHPYVINSYDIFSLDYATR